MSIVCRIDQLHRDFQTVIDSLHGAFEYGGDTKFLGDLGHPSLRFVTKQGKIDRRKETPRWQIS